MLLSSFVVEWSGRDLGSLEGAALRLAIRNVMLDHAIFEVKQGSERCFSTGFGFLHDHMSHCA